MSMLLTFVGGAGVSLSFALSGFLIGRIALRSIGTLQSIMLFWQRRWFRTLPASLTVAVLVACLLHPSALNFLSTISATRGFARDALHSSFLPHYWSLMVEEWFYLLLPVLLLAIGRGRWRLAWLGAAWLALVLFHILAAWALRLDFWQQMTLTWMRLDAILAGVVVAAAEPLLTAAMRRVLCAVGSAGIAAIFLALTLTDAIQDYDPLLLTVPLRLRNLGDFAHATEASLVPMLWAITLPAVAGWRPARQAGPDWQLVQVAALLSYPLYLVHWDVFRLVADMPVGRLHPFYACCLALPLSLLAAILLHVVVARPFMALRERVAPERRPRHEPLPVLDEQLAGLVGRDQAFTRT